MNIREYSVFFLIIIYLQKLKDCFIFVFLLFLRDRSD